MNDATRPPILPDELEILGAERFHKLDDEDGDSWGRRVGDDLVTAVRTPDGWIVALSIRSGPWKGDRVLAYSTDLRWPMTLGKSWVIAYTVRHRDRFPDAKPRPECTCGNCFDPAKTRNLPN